MSTPNLLRRHPLTLYFVLAFGLAWTGIVLVTAERGIPAHGEDAAALFVPVFLAMLAGPSTAGLVTTAVAFGLPGLRAYARRLVHVRFEGQWWLSLLVAPVLLLATLTTMSLGDPAYMPGLFTSKTPLAVAAFALAGGLGAGVFEELGWTGFATPVLLSRNSALRAGLFLGILWALWHFLGDFWGGADALGVWYVPHFVSWVVALSAYRIFMTWVFEHTRSTLLGMLLHAVFTGGQSLLWPLDVTPAQSFAWYAVFAVLLWVVVGLVALGDRHHLVETLAEPA